MVTSSHSKTPSLDLVQIASPCTADWDAMSGDERMRHCGDCNLNVYNISDMSRDEALAFLAQREGGTCVRMLKRPDGTVITRDCPVGLAAVRAKFVRLSLATAGLILAMLTTATAACAKVPYLRMGAICLPELPNPTSALNLPPNAQPTLGRLKERPQTPRPEIPQP